MFDKPTKYKRTNLYQWLTKGKVYSKLGLSKNNQKTIKIDKKKGK